MITSWLALYVSFEHPTQIVYKPYLVGTLERRPSDEAVKNDGKLLN